MLHYPTSAQFRIVAVDTLAAEGAQLAVNTQTLVDTYGAETYYAFAAVEEESLVINFRWKQLGDFNLHLLASFGFSSAAFEWQIVTARYGEIGSLASATY